MQVIASTFATFVILIAIAGATALTSDTAEAALRTLTF